MIAPDAHDIARVVGALAANADALESELNAADSKLGDGDTGTMLVRMIRRMAETPLGDPSTNPGPAFITLARAGAATTGSSLGTLVIAGLMAIGKACGDNPVETAPTMPKLLEIAAVAIRQRGGAKEGDKSVLDALERLVLELSSPEAGKAQAVKATRAALDDFREKPCRLGRARMFGARSIGVDDPGMLALHRVVEIIAR